MVAIICIDLCNVVIAVATGTDTSPHQLLKENFLSIIEVDNEIYLGAAVSEHPCLQHSAGDPVKDQTKMLRILIILLDIIDHINHSLVIN